MEKVGIIGGAGFIGSYITALFLEQGYEVKVSTTDITSSGKYDHLMQLEKADQLHIAELDVLNKQQLANFASDCDIIIHCGTPFQLDFTDAQKELIEPTIKGTENFLEVVSTVTSVKKVVFVASVGAMNTNFPLPADGKSPEDIFTENESYFFSEESHPYAQAKFIANQTVDKYIQEHPDLRFEITSISPVMVVGKSMSKRGDSTSTNMQALLKAKLAPNPFMEFLYAHDVLFSMVSVTDVAKAAFKAATLSGNHGENFLIATESYPVSDITNMLNGQASAHPGKQVYRNEKSKKLLGMTFLPIRNALENAES